MKIIHCLNHFLPHQIAGTEVYVWALCKQLQEMGCEVKVLIPHYEFTESADYVYDGIPVHQYSEPTVVDRDLILGLRVAEGIKHFKRYLLAEKPDVVHFHEIAGSNGISVAHLEAAKATGAKVVFTIHLSSITCHTGTLMFENREVCDGLMQEAKCGYCALVRRTSHAKAKFIAAVSRPLHKLDINLLHLNNPVATALSYPFVIKKLKGDLKRIVKSCDLLIPITQWYSEILKTNGVPEQKIKVIQQGLPLSSDLPKKSEVNHKGPLKLFFLGRIDELKGISLLLQAFLELSPAEAELDIYGSGPDKDFVQHCMQLTAGYVHIKWKGRLKQSEVLSTMRLYDAIVLPSMFSEMSPLVIQEAFAIGIPVIGSNVYGIAELIKDGENGLLFEFGQKDSLVQKIRTLANDRSFLKKMTLNEKTVFNFQKVAAATWVEYCRLLEEPQYCSVKM